MPRDYFKSTLEYRLLQQHGERLPEVLRELYVTRKLPLRETMKELGCNSIKITSRLLEKYGVTVRRGSEAVANQWARNPDRKNDVSGLLARAERGEHWAKGLTKETDRRLASISRKLVESRRCITPSAIAKGVATRLAQLRADPRSHSQARAKATPAEVAFMWWLEERCIRYEFQFPIVTDETALFVDFYLPDLNLIVEVCKMRQRFPLARARELYSRGYLAIAIPNGAVLGRRFSKVEEIVSRVKRGEFNPTTLGECWVSLRAHTMRAADASDLDQPIR